MDDRTTLVYIMGRGYSGSTILDWVLGNAAGVVSLGELAAGLDRTDYPCGCGRSFGNCPFWTDVRSEFVRITGTTWETGAGNLKRQAHPRRFVETLMRPLNSDSGTRLRRINEALVAAVTEASGCRVVVDSSKEVSRALFLVRHFPKSKVIHLVRDPRSVVASYFWRMEKGNGFRILRRTYSGDRWRGVLLTIAALSWTLGNILAEVVSTVAPSRVLRVRYEDLMTGPRTELARIARFMDLDLDCVVQKIESGESLLPTHGLAGNRIRRQGAVRFDPTRARRYRLPLRYAIGTSLLCWPLLWKYGYQFLPRGPVDQDRAGGKDK